MKIKIAIYDEQVAESQKLRNKILEYAELNQLDIEVLLYYIGEHLRIDISDGKVCPDILFLGIELSESNGAKLARELREVDYRGKIIFFTNSEEYYQDAFDVRAFHYILKRKTPQERFQAILEHSIDEVIEEEREYIILSRQGEMKKLPLDDIQYFEVYGRVVIVHYQEDKIFEFYSQLVHLENKLIGHGFMRTHKSYLVNLLYVEDISIKQLTLADGTKLAVGRAYYHKVKETMNDFNYPLKRRQIKEFWNMKELR